MDKREKRKDQEVPLVIYKGGEKIAIGHAILKGDGSLSGQVTKDVMKELSDLLFGGSIGDVSLNPKISVQPDLKYNLISANEARAIIRQPPKIQEQ